MNTYIDNITILYKDEIMLSLDVTNVNSKDSKASPIKIIKLVPNA